MMHRYFLRMSGKTMLYLNLVASQWGILLSADNLSQAVLTQIRRDKTSSLMWIQNI